MEALDKYFKMTERGTTLGTEIRAGITTFLTLCYILAVNSRLLGDSGGPCECSEALKDVPGCAFFDPEYDQCLEEFRRQLVTVTAVSAGTACVLMGGFANLPFALAPGMGLNAYFTYDVVGVRGSGNIPWKTALAAVFIEGIVFFVLTITGLRVLVAKLIPKCLKLSMTGGIGMFLAHLGLQTAEGIGLVVSDVATGLTLGGCPPKTRRYAAYLYSEEIANYPGDFFPITADTYTCDPPNPGDPDERMLSPTTWLGICTVFIIGVMLKNKVKGAIIMGVLMASIISWFKGNSGVSYFRDEVYPLGGGGGLGGGEYRWEYFKKVAKVEGMDMTAGKLSFDWDGGNLALALFTFLYVDSLDTMGTLFAMARFAGLMKDNGDFDGSTRAFMVDSFTTSFGALLGTSPVTTYIESAPGIEEGGRTGLVAITVGILFYLCCFFAPIFASIPPWATGPALIVVGAMMMRPLVEIDWYDYGQAIPAFITVIIMPLTYSIAYGIIGGLMSFLAINGLDFIVQAIMGKKPWESEDFRRFVASLQGKDLPPSESPPSPPTAEDVDAKTRDISFTPPAETFKPKGVAPEAATPAPQRQSQFVYSTMPDTGFPMGHPGGMPGMMPPGMGMMPPGMGMMPPGAMGGMPSQGMYPQQW